MKGEQLCSARHGRSLSNEAGRSDKLSLGSDRRAGGSGDQGHRARHPLVQDLPYFRRLLSSRKRSFPSVSLHSLPVQQPHRWLSPPTTPRISPFSSPSAILGLKPLCRQKEVKSQASLSRLMTPAHFAPAFFIAFGQWANGNLEKYSRNGSR